MYITMGTAVYGYISYEFLGLFEAVQCVPCNLAANGDQHARVRRKTADTTSVRCWEKSLAEGATTPTTAKAGLHSPRHDHLAGQSRVKTPPPRPLPHREVAVGMSYSLLWPPSEPTFSQTGSLGNVGGN